MSILSAWRLTRAATELDPTVTSGSNVGIRSPWQAGNLSHIVWNDIFDADAQPATRAHAMRVPAVANARHTLVAAIAGLPLRAMRRDQVLPPDQQPTWTYRTSGPVSPWHRMAWTLDDILFTGWSLWAVTRDAAGHVLEADRTPPEWWSFDSDGSILVLDQPVSAEEVVLIPGPAEGLLEYAGESIRGALNMDRAWQGRVRSPIPAMEIRQTTDDELEDDEADELITAYVKARQDPNGAVVLTPYGFELVPHGDSDTNLFIEGRNAIRIDVANYTGLPGAALDGALSTASLTYVTQDGKRSELAEALKLWMDPITARLSQDDVVPRGVRVAFDTTDLTDPAPTGPTLED